MAENEASERITFDLPKLTAKKLRTLAKREDMSLSATIRKAVRKLLGE